MQSAADSTTLLADSAELVVGIARGGLFIQLAPQGVALGRGGFATEGIRATARARTTAWASEQAFEKRIGRLHMGAGQTHAARQFRIGGDNGDLPGRWIGTDPRDDAVIGVAGELHVDPRIATARRQSATRVADIEHHP